MSDDRQGRITVNLVSETVGGATGHGVHTAFTQTLEALRRAGIDVRVNEPGCCDVAHIETMGPQGLKALLQERGHVVVTAHIVPESLVGSFAFARLWLPIARAYMRFFYSRADLVLAVSPAVAEGLARMGLRVPVRVVPNAIDVRRFRPRAGQRDEVRRELGIPSEAFVAISTGQIQPRKGVDTFVRVARECPDATFLWLGGMPFKMLTAGFRRMMRTTKRVPPNCRFLGEVPHEEVPRYLAAADCLLFPSRQETFGFTIVEAAAAGLPLVLRDLDVYRPLFDDAYLACHESGFSTAVRRLMVDPALRAEYAARAERIAQRYGLEAHAEALLDAYRSVLQRNAASASPAT
ncbi:MAG: glycosyltransferase family 4 protein [Coriobacteriia bacterium]|nr:glycosyltransferase family 4 protein [Coriobacteriia bacterium]MDI6713097.1 glycosyltransferase family 4 protein [Anaerosomatales bacterium]